ncbi:MAG: hypothetical protein U0R52_05835 [Solirubrobacterales bacterium]
MGFLDKLKEKGRGVVTSAKPQDGVPAADAVEVRSRLLAISGKGIETGEDGEEIVVAWSAKVSSAGVGGAESEYRYRAIRITLEPDSNTASGICFRTDTDAEIGADGTFSASKGWEKGQHVGSETMHVIAWLGPHSTEGGADESGYKFSWGDLREPVMDAVTGAGWTYKPKQI